MRKLDYFLYRHHHHSNHMHLCPDARGDLAPNDQGRFAAAVKSPNWVVTLTISQRQMLHQGRPSFQLSVHFNSWLDSCPAPGVTVLMTCFKILSDISAYLKPYHSALRHHC